MSSTKKTREVKLTVYDASPRDVGRGRVRLPPHIMQYLGVTIGDIVEIIGKKRTAAIVWPARNEDYGKDIIRMDGLIRRNAGVTIGDRVTVRKAEVKEASLVKLAPVSYDLLSDRKFALYVKKRLRDYPLTEGDVIKVPVIGQPIEFLVVSTKPSGIVVVKDKTEIVIYERPIEVGKVPRVTYEDIGDLEEAKQRIREMIELPLKHPEIFKKLGIEPPKGVLLYGPPGCGKTLLAKAVANETDAYFIHINGPEIMSKYYGESEARLREIFEEAKNHAPAIIFIDEIDAIAPKREEVTGEVEKRVVAQLLALMDGLEERGQVIVIAATNRPEALDPALRRPGRFDREILIPVPDKKGRKEILQIHTRNVPLADDVDLDEIAEITHGFTGADLAALVREAAMHALRRFLPYIDLEKGEIPRELLEKLKVTREDFMAALREIQPSAMREVYVEVPEVHWDDIGGLEEVKQELREAVEWPLKKPDWFIHMGIEPPKGILLYGPPGCGKTLLAKAVATESGANFISVRGPEIFSKWVGESEKAIRQIFRRARQVAPAVIFFDEIDAIAPRRGLYVSSGVEEKVVNQLLTEMDGIAPLKNVVVVAATNRPDLLDPALLRPGRFDRLIYVPPPDYKARLQILKIHTKKTPLAEDVDLEEIAKRTEYYSGADLEAVVKEAALIALREKGRPTKVCMEHFERALKKVRPSITPQIIEYYEKFTKEYKALRAERRRPTPYTA